MITIILYPVIVTLTAFYFFEFDDNNLESMLDWMLIMTLTALVGGMWGFSLGTFMKNEVTATQLNMLFLIMYSFGAGFYANTGEDQNPIVYMISYISPLRCTTELLMSRVVADKPGGDQILDHLGFTWGTSTCIELLSSLSGFYFIVGWLSLLWKSRDV